MMDANFSLLFLRVAVGAIFLAHGLSKRGMWKMQPSEQMSGGMLGVMRLLSVVEPLGGVAVLLGFLTNWAAMGLGVIMLGAIWLKMTKWKMPFSAHDKLGWEFDLLILSVLVALLAFGPGAWAVMP